MKPTHTIILILGILLVFVAGDVAGPYLNRYSLEDGGKYRIDHLSGQVWEKKTKEVFDIEVARETYERLLEREPEFENEPEAKVINWIHQQYLVSNDRSSRNFECMRSVSYWEIVYLSEEEATAQGDELPSMIATSLIFDDEPEQAD